MFIKRKPRLVPLTIPQTHLIPLPEPNAMLQYASETLAFASLARELARDPEIREQSASLVTGLVDCFRPEPPNQAEEEILLKALGASVRLGWAFAKVEETLKSSRPSFSDGRIHNAVIGAAGGLSDFPEELQMKMFYALQCGYYVGRTGDRDGVLGGDASEGNASPPGAGGHPRMSDKQTSSEGKKAFLVFHVPFWRDWLCWATALGVFAGAHSTFQDYRGDILSGLTRFSALALSIDLLVVVGFYLVFFGFGAGALRKALRRRRNSFPRPTDRARGALWLSLLGLVVLLPVGAAYGSISAGPPFANQAEQQTCAEAQNVVNALEAANSATNRAEGLTALEDQVRALGLMATHAQETGNARLASEALSTQEVLAASIEALLAGDALRARSNAEDGDVHFDALAAECRGLGLALTPPG